MAVACIQAVILAGLLFLSLYYLQTTNDQSFSERYTAEAMTLSILVREAVLTSDLAILEDMAANFMNTSNAVYLKIYDNQNLLIEKKINESLITSGMADVSLTKVTDNVFDLKQVIYASEFAIGKIELGFGVAEYQALMAGAESTLSIFVLFGLFIIVIVSWALGGLLTGDLSNFRQALLRIERGYIDELPESSRNSEFRELAEGFNEMSRSLQLREQERDLAEVGLLKAKDIAEKTSQSKTEFMSHITHEIRSPLNGLMGCVDLLSETQLDQQQMVYIQAAQQSSKSLLSLINNFLDITRIESGALQLSESQFDLIAMSQEILSSKALQTHNKLIELCLFVHPSVPHICFGDEARIRQVLVNLLDNAVKFTSVGGVVFELLSADMKKSSFNLIFHVKDSGIGIPKTKQEMIFDEFTQVDNSDATLHGGAGLGLSICKQLVSIMEGDISIESEINQGTNFTISLPLRYVHKAAGLRKLSSKILICSRNTTLSSTLKKQLTYWGADVSIYTDIEDVVDMDTAQIIFLDDASPLSSDLMRKLIELRNQSACKIILLTNQLIESNKLKVDVDYYDSVLNKPIKVTELSDVLGLEECTNIDLNKTQPNKSSELKIGRILLAEDSLTNQMVATAMLEKDGYTVSIANNGHEALAKLEESMFDLVLMDIRMPRMDGIETTKRIREKKSCYQSIPIIALTANALQNEKDKCEQAGMNGFISKPIQKKELIQAIEHCLIEEGNMTREEYDSSSLNELEVMSDKTLERLVQETSEAMVERMVGMFVVEAQRRFDAIKTGLLTTDFEAIEAETHTLKSNAATFGALKLAELAKTMELACKRMDEAVVLSVFRETEQVLSTTLSLYKKRYNISSDAQ